MIRATLTASALLLAGGAWLHLDTVKRAKAGGYRAGYADGHRDGWQRGAEAICEKGAQGLKSEVKGVDCYVQSTGGRWHTMPPVVSRGGGE